MARAKFNVPNEQFCIAWMLRDADARKMILGSLREDDFQGAFHKAIFTAVAACVTGGCEPDIAKILVNARGEIGGQEYLNDLYAFQLGDGPEYHVEKVIQDRARFLVGEHVDELKSVLADKTVPFAECLSIADNIVSAMRASQTLKRGGDTLAQWRQRFQDRLDGKMSFQSVGFQSLDAMLVEGFAKGLLTVIGGRTRMGKSTLIADIVRRLLSSRNKPRMLVVPFEGGPSTFIDMLVSASTGIPLATLIKHPEEMAEGQRSEAKRNAEKILGDDRLEVEDNFFSDLAMERKFDGKKIQRWGNEAVLDRMEQLMSTGSYDIIFWDLWQRAFPRIEQHDLMVALNRFQRDGSRYKTHNVITQQLKRDLEGRKDRRPSLTDLKQAGDYEEVADLVFLIHREKVFKPFMRDDVLEVNIAKQKRGEAGWTMLADVRADICRFENDRIGEPISAKKARFSNEDEVL